MPYQKVVDALNDKEKYLIAQLAPAVRVSIGEEFGYSPGEIVTKKVVGALKEIGFQKVFDTSTSADIVTIEEAHELMLRKLHNGKLPLLTSCCPGFVSYIEHAHPELIENLCTAKSPMETMGTLIKTYYAELNGIDPNKIYVVGIMPCIIKKLEARKKENFLNGKEVVDHVITTVELAELLKEKKIDLKKVKEQEFDQILGESSGAGNIFGSTGGVMEAVLRLYSKAIDKPLGKIEFQQLRGLEGIKTAETKIGNEKIKVAVINGLRNASELLSNPKKLNEYTIIEGMACFGGCVGGAGQPNNTEEKIKKRKEALYKIDYLKTKNVASENLMVKKIYKEFIGKPGNEKAKKLLHTNRKK